MKESDKIRENIRELVKKYFDLEFGKCEFVPGESQVKYSGRVFDEEEIINLVDSSLDFWLTSGRYAGQFEKKFADYHNMKYCTLANSGSSANLLAVSALTSYKLGDRRLKPNDEIITVAAAFPTTIAPIIQNNLVPVFVDIDLSTLNIDIDKVEYAISSKTKAIFIAHTLGNPFHLKKILDIKDKYNLWLIEDACDALGAKFNDAFVGTFGDISTFSFYPAHHITMGEGGALLTDNTQLYRNILSFRDWGRDCWCAPGKNNTCGRRFTMQLGGLPMGYDHKFTYSHLGYNLKITDMQAAVGVAQLGKLDEFIAKRNSNFKKYYNFFKEYEKYFILPESYPESTPSWFGFPLTVRGDAPFSRKNLVTYLDGNKIDTRMLFAGNVIRQPAFDNVKYKIAGSLEQTDMCMNNTFWFGVYPGLDDNQLDYIFQKAREFLARY